jgi:uncharacterized RDD family membrane protein YckC
MNNQFCSGCGKSLMATMRICPYCGGKSFSASPPSNPISNQSQNATVSAASLTGTQVRPNIELAERGTRLGAVMLDFLIFIVCLIPGIIALTISGSDGGKGFGWALIAVGWIGLYVVQMVFLVKYGQSLGKRALGIQIVKISDESVPGFVKVVVLRSFVPGLIALIPFAGGVIAIADALFIFRDDRRCLHDLIAETKVIKV